VRYLVIGMALLLGLAPAQAADRVFETQVEESVRSTLPDDWWLRASWRDKALVVFVSPPIAQAFKLWYDEAKQMEVLTKICRDITPAVWSRIEADQDIALEPVIGGNGGKGSWRLSCKDVLAGKVADKRPVH
jgi:hypothetical protein